MTHSGHAWLTAVLPAGARRVRTDDPALRETLRRAGAELVEDGADVEIVSSRRPRGDAVLAVVLASRDRPEGGLRLVRGVLRVKRALHLRAKEQSARIALRRSGYSFVTSLLGDLNAPLPLVDGLEPASPKLPLRAAITGRKKAGTEPSILEDALRLADVRPRSQPQVREGVVVLVGEEGVLRVSLGPGGRLAEEQRAALELLEAGPLPAVVRDRVPWPLGNGTVGLGSWTLERRLPGAPPAAVDEGIAAQAMEFVVALHGVAREGEAPTLAERAEVVAASVRPDVTRMVQGVAERLDASLAHVPRGFAHGDFHRGNLLVEGDRLTGVIDWDHAGAGRLPLLDLYHFLVSERRRRRRLSLGRSVVEVLVPSVAAGKEPSVREYCAAVGMNPEPSVLVDLALAYWLDFVARDLELYADRARRKPWMQENVYLVVERGTRWFR